MVTAQLPGFTKTIELPPVLTHNSASKLINPQVLDLTLRENPTARLPVTHACDQVIPWKQRAINLLSGCGFMVSKFKSYGIGETDAGRVM